MTHLIRIPSAVRTTLVALAALLATVQAAAAPTSIAVPHEVESWRSSFVAAQHTYNRARALSSSDATQFALGRLADKPVAVMLFTVEGVRGPADWLQYVATFWFRGGNYLFCCVHRVGGKGLQLINDLQLEPDRVILAGNTYRSSDAVCCPSKPVTLRLALERRRLVELGGTR
jgi:hypothetical protein